MHSGVQWIFDGAILGVMSDTNGILEAASTFELGNPLTNYNVPIGGSPFHGTEATDSYTVNGNTLTVNMRTSEPGDWIRVITVASKPDIAVSEPSTLALVVLVLAILGFVYKKPMNVWKHPGQQ